VELAHRPLDPGPGEREPHDRTEVAGREGRPLLRVAEHEFVPALEARAAPVLPQRFRELLPQTVAELERLGLSPKEVALDGGFQTKASLEALAPLAPERVYIAGRSQPGSKRTQRRLARYRTGAEGRISHLKRNYGVRRSRLKGAEGQRIWNGWAAFAYNLDTYGKYA
jgi:IS5 family transposase